MLQPEITIKDLEPFRKAYDKAVKEGKDYFTYRGRERVTSYVKYLLECLQSLKNEKS